MQVGIDLLRSNESARLLVANVEMAPTLLVERTASRLSAVPLTAITDRSLTVDQLDRVRAAVDALVPVADRLAFLKAPFALEHVAAAGTAFGANVLMLDYIQRFTVGDGAGDNREQLETAATVLRRFCDAGAAVLVASAVARQKHAGGSTYNGLNLASFRGSSELEYGTDDAYLLVPAGAAESCSSVRRGGTGSSRTSRSRSTRRRRRSGRRRPAWRGSTPRRPPPRGEARRRGADVQSPPSESILFVLVAP